MQKKNYSIIILFLFSSILIGIGIYETIPLYTNISDLFTIPRADALKTSSYFSLGYAIGFLSVTPLIKKYNSRLILLLALSFSALTTFSLALTQSFSLLLLLRFLQGFSSSFFAPIAFASVIALISERQVPLANSMITSGFIISSVIGQIFSVTLFNLAGWKTIFYTQAALMLILAVILYIVLPSLPKPSEKLHYLKTIGHIFRKPQLLIQYYVTFILLFSFVSMYSLITTSHLVVTSQLMNFREWGLLGIFLGILGTMNINDFNKHSYLSYALLMSALGSLMLSLFHSNALLITGSIFFALGITMSLPLAVSNIGKLSEKDDLSITIVLYTFILFIGATIGPIITNYISNHAGSSSYSFLFIMFLLLVGSILEFQRK